MDEKPSMCTCQVCGGSCYIRIYVECVVVNRRTGATTKGTFCGQVCYHVIQGRK